MGDTRDVMSILPISELLNQKKNYVKKVFQFVHKTIIYMSYMAFKTSSKQFNLSLPETYLYICLDPGSSRKSDILCK